MIRRLFLCCVLSLFPSGGAGAHEIPTRALVQIYARVVGDTLRLVIRAPLQSMRDVDFPMREDGYLVISRSEPLAREAAELWLLGYLRTYENGELLKNGRVKATRISAPSDKSFTSWVEASAHARAAPLPDSIDLPLGQALIDAIVDFPVASPASAFALEPELGHLGQRTTTALRYVTVSGAERAYEYLGNPGRIPLDPRWLQAVWRFVVLGVQHILSGIDHLLFILCLVVPFRRLRPLVAIVTAFTVAHSITLIASAYGFAPSALWFPPFIELLIALSIVWMACENILKPQLGRRWVIAFVFGLVHGFGFSFALRDSLQFAGTHLVTSLASFNVGVEMGQLAAVAVAVPVLSWLWRRVPERGGTILLSALILHSAWHWMTERWGAFRQYDFSWESLGSVSALSLVRLILLLGVIAAALWLLSMLVGRILRGEAAAARVPSEG